LVVNSRTGRPNRSTSTAMRCAFPDPRLGSDGAAVWSRPVTDAKQWKWPASEASPFAPGASVGRGWTW
jgi:hypothetical protein